MIDAGVNFVVSSNRTGKFFRSGSFVPLRTKWERRVTDAAYFTRAEAIGIRNRLRENGYDCEVLEHIS